MGPFKKWLVKQINSRTLEPWQEDFAEDVKDDKTFPQPKSLDALTGYLRHKRACPEAIEAAKACYELWLGGDPKARMDGFSPKDKERVRKATRQVWSWSYPRRLCIERCTDEEGFYWCELCKERSPKIHVDHIKPAGKMDRGYMERLFCESRYLQALCPKCHRVKTNKEARKRAQKKKAWEPI